MSRNRHIATSALEYRDIAALDAASALASLPPIAAGVPEPEVQRRVQEAHEAALASAEHRARTEAAQQQAETRRQTAQTLDTFRRERAAYFSRVEAGIVQLALAIARKILQRESEIDPTLLAGLVRTALDSMQNGSAVQVRVVPAEAELWRTLAGGPGEGAQWQVEEDPLLQPGDCIVRTEVGDANFGLEAQLLDVEQSFRGLLAHKPVAS